MKSFSKIVCFVILAVFATFYACQKQNSSVLDSTEAINTTNVVTIEEAKAVYAQYLDNHKGGSSTLQVRSSDELNPYDLVPKWGEADNRNFIDTAGNLLAVPTESFLGNGYRKLMFFRDKGQIKLLIANVICTAEYMNRKKGVCTMDDFTGVLIFQNDHDVKTGGYKFENGQTISVFLPDRTPVSGFELDYWSTLGGPLPEVVITSDRPRGGASGTLESIGFGVFNAMMEANMANFSQNTFNGFGSTFGSGSNPNAIIDGIAFYLFDAAHPICPTSITLVPVNNVNGGTPASTVGLSNFGFQVPYLDWQGTPQSKQVTFGNMVINLPPNANTQMISNAFSAAVNALENMANNTNGRIITKSEFQNQLSIALMNQVRGTISPTNPLTLAITVTNDPREQTRINGTQFREPTFTCP